MATENRYEFLKKLGVGFESVLSVVDSLGPAYFSEDYPTINNYEIFLINNVSDDSGKIYLLDLTSS